MKKSILFLFLLLLPIVHAVGIASNNDPISIMPDSQQTLRFHLINNKDQEINVKLSISGPMAPYITLEEEEITLTKKGEIRTIFAKVIFPKKIEHLGDTFLIATEENQQQQGQFHVRLHSAAKIKFLAPDQIVKQEPVVIFQQPPPQPEKPSPAVEIGDFFTISANAIQRILYSKLILLLLSIMLLILAFDLQLYLYRRRMRESIIQEILER
ncbi:hypothetical protein HYS48_02345 [Candidatus Woesearchaeota archaeon]|nr:hypothetical protein [Candidatus Woesearchaeota archaeon]